MSTDHPLFRFVVEHPVAVAMLFLAAAVFGYVSYQRLPVELMPDLAYPTITVRTGYDGAAPQEVEQDVSRPIEEALATLDSLVTLESRSRAGTSDVVLGFRWGTDMGAAVQSVRESLQQAWLGEGIDRPLILRYDPSLEPFLRLALAMEPDHPGASDESALYLLREVSENEIKRDLEGLDGVAAVRVRGGLEREIRVAVREDWLIARSVRLDQVQGVLARENVNLAGGSVLEGDTEFLVRTLNEFTTLAEIRELKILRDDGTTVPLTDVATVTEAHREREVLAHLDGAEAVELEIFKEADSNVVEVARGVKEHLLGDPDAQQNAEWMKQMGMPVTESVVDRLPDGVVLEVLDDQAAFIEIAVANLRNTALLGGVFAVGVLFLFLRDFRSTFIIGLAIPVSVIVGFGPLYLWDVTLNLMSLGGLALGVGMLVDNAVVVLESIQRHREEGASRRDAAVSGTAAVASAVTASTLTTVAVFLPISFVEGVAGVLFGDLAIAVTSSLLASLVVALLLVPMLASLSLPDASDVLSLPGGLGVEARRRAWDQAVDEPAAVRRKARVQAIDALVSDALRPATSQLQAGIAWSRERWWRRLLLPYLLGRFAAGLAMGVALAMVYLGLWFTRWASRVGAAVLRPLSRVAVGSAGRFAKVYSVTERFFAGALRWALPRRGPVVVAATVTFVLAMLGMSAVGTELIPEVHQGRFTVELELPVGTPLQRTAQVVTEAEGIVAGHPAVRSVYATAGADRRIVSSSSEGEHTAKLRVVLDESAAGAAAELGVAEALRGALAELPDVRTNVVRPALFSFRTPVEVVLYGWDLRELREVGDQVAETLAGEGGLRDVRSSLVRGYPEVQVHYDRARLRRFGLDPGTVAARVRDKVKGVEATEIRRGDTRVALRVQLVEGDRSSLDDLGMLNVNPSLNPAIPLSAVADLVAAEGPSEIRRVDQQRAVVVSGNVEGLDLGSVAASIEERLYTLDLPEDVAFALAGQTAEMKESLGSLRFALGLAVFLVYVIMASTFENLLHPLVILLSVPLAAVGVSVGLGLTGLPVSVVVFIGLIVLAGVVVNNAIVLVDTINRIRRTGVDRLSAIHQGSALRLRPILITTATTVLGLLPLSLGLGAGSEVQQPLAVTVIGGLLSSTVLTLVVVPVIYAVVTGRSGRAPVPAPPADAEAVP